MVLCGNSTVTSFKYVRLEVSDSPLVCLEKALLFVS
jgi:hypothetical protein